jgi:hypothetical protein
MNKEFLYAEEFCMDVMSSPFWAEDGEVIVDAGFVVKSNMNNEKTREAAALTRAINVSGTGSGLLRWIATIGEDGKKYLAVANFGEKAVCMKPDTRNIKQISWCGDKISLNSDSIHTSGDSNSIRIPGDSEGIHTSGDSNSICIPGNSEGIHIPGDSNSIHIPGDSNSIHIPGNSGAILEID